MSEISTDYEAIKNRPGVYWMRLSEESKWSIAHVDKRGKWTWRIESCFGSSLDSGEWIHIPDPTDTPDKKPEKKQEPSIASLTITSDGKNIAIYRMGDGKSRNAVDLLADLVHSLSETFTD